MKQLIKNTSYSIFSNFITLGISTVMVLIVPKVIGVKEYGYWQLYMFYASYVGVLAFGWLDGIYLRFGGESYDKLNKRLFHSQFMMFLLIQIIISLVIITVSFFNNDNNMQYIFQMVAIYLVLYNMKTLILYILQDTNRIKEYAIVNSVGRVLYFLLVIFVLLIKFTDYKLLIIADLLGRAVDLLFGLYTIRDIVFLKLGNFYWSFKEAWINISIGVKLLVANLAGILIIGIVRYGIQFFWGVSVFGKVSLTLSVSNLIMTFISAVSLVLYPMLRGMSHEKATILYPAIKETLIIILFIGMFLYYPISYILPLWLPQYRDSLIYLPVLFPMCVYQGKFELLISTFLKTFRYEKALLNINLISLLVSAFVTTVNVLFIHKLTVIMFSIILILWIQSNVGEIYLAKQLKIKIYHEIVLETILVIAFMLSGWILQFPYNIFIYTITFLLYLWIKRKKIQKGIVYIKSSMSHNS